MRRSLLLAPAVGLGLVTAAAAEPPIGSRLGDRLRGSAHKVDEAVAARHAQALAACIVNKRRAAAERLLAAADAQALERAHRSAWNGLTCYSGFDPNDEFVEGRRFSVPLDIERGLFAEQLLRGMDRQVAALPALPLRQGFYKRAWFAGTSRSPVVDEMGACLADAAPVGIRALLQTIPHSADEKAALGRLSPMMGGCLSAGAKLVGNRQSVRAALADALYQRVMNPAASMAPVEQAKK